MSKKKILAALTGLALLTPVSDAIAKQRAFPVTIKAANGSVTIKQRPARIVILSPSATETAFRVGAGRQVIAVDDQSDFPRGVPRTRLSSHRPNAEAIAAYRPDLVITSSDANRVLPALKRLRIPTLWEPAPDDIAGAYRQMRQIGLATGHRAAANRLVTRMRSRIAATVRSVGPARGVSFFHELTPDLYTVTSRSFIGRVYRLFGLTNIADKAGKAIAYPQLSGEYVIASDPTFLLLADSECCKQNASAVARRPGWGSMSAVTKRRVFAVNDDIPSRWGPRIVDFVALVGRIVRQVRN